MTKLTNQEIFDKALFGIREQGTQASQDTSGRCLYRSGIGSCAIGHCIDDETAKEWDEAEGDITEISERGDGLYHQYVNYFNEDQLGFLLDLQKAHDEHLAQGKGSPHQWELQMKEIAENFNLRYKSLDTSEI